MLKLFSPCHGSSTVDVTKHLTVSLVTELNSLCIAMSEVFLIVTLALWRNFVILHIVVGFQNVKAKLSLDWLDIRIGPGNQRYGPGYFQ